MLAWIRRLFAAPPPPPPRLAQLAGRLDDVELELEQLNARLEDNVKAIHARITNKLRRGEAEPGEDELGAEQPEQPEPKRFAPAPTAHLAKRFRRF